MKPPRTAKYLLRFDDLCPTMNWQVWGEIEAALEENQVKPILAVVPDNRDPVLQVEPAVKDFWGKVRGWQARGWAIGLHGFQHKYVAVRPGIVTPRKKTEFAGVPPAEQEEKLRRGMEIFEREGIKARVWIAPSNSFDAATVALLPKFGIRVICDGCFRFPFADQQKIFWVPQQLFCFRPAPRGIWTVCHHHNRWGASDLDKFREDLRRFRADLWTLDDVLQTWADRRSWWSAKLCTSPRFSQLLIRVELKLWEQWTPSRNPSSPHAYPFPPVERSSAPN